MVPVQWLSETQVNGEVILSLLLPCLKYLNDTPKSSRLNIFDESCYGPYIINELFVLDNNKTFFYHKFPKWINNMDFFYRGYLYLPDKTQLLIPNSRT